MKKLISFSLLVLCFAFGVASAQSVTQRNAWGYGASDLYRDGGKANVLMTGGGTVTVSAAGELGWSDRFIILGGGRGAGSMSTQGYYDIYRPAAGTVITGICGAANTTATAAGVNLAANIGSWSALWYQLPVGASSTVPANFKLAGYTADCVIPSDYVLVGAYNQSSASIKLGTGQIIKNGQSNSSLWATSLTSATPASSGATGTVAALGVDSTGKVVVQSAPAPAVVGGQINGSNIASYSNNAPVTGALVIKTKIPAPSYTMFDVRIEGYDYSTTAAWDMQLGGYMYNPLGWYNTGWQGVNRFVGRGVQYGTEGGFVVFVLGTTTSAWSYPKINIRSAMAGYTSAQPTYLQGWTIELRATLAAVANLHTPPLINTAPSYATQAAANADAALPVNAMYRVGSQVYIK